MNGLMNLQFGSEKCVKMHVERIHDNKICCDITVDTWREEVTEDKNGTKILIDKYIGKDYEKCFRKSVFRRCGVKRW